MGRALGLKFRGPWIKGFRDQVSQFQVQSLTRTSLGSGLPHVSKLSTTPAMTFTIIIEKLSISINKPAMFTGKNNQQPSVETQQLWRLSC